MKVITKNEKINNLDLSPIIKKISNPKDELTWNSGWKEKDALLVAELYRSFLFLCYKYPDEIIVPTKEIDEFWHTHILFTQKYYNDCQEIFGRFLHHYPLGSEEDHHKEEKAWPRTLEILKIEFPFLGAEHV